MIFCFILWLCFLCDFRYLEIEFPLLNCSHRQCSASIFWGWVGNGLASRGGCCPGCYQSPKTLPEFCSAVPRPFTYYYMLLDVLRCSISTLFVICSRVNIASSWISVSWARVVNLVFSYCSNVILISKLFDADSTSNNWVYKKPVHGRPQVP